MKALKIYWETLNDRERLMFTTGAIFLICYIFYAGIYSPLSSAVSEKKILLVEEKETLKWMEEVNNKYDNIKVSEPISSDQVLTLLSEQLKQSNLQRYTYQLEQTSTGDFQLSFEEVPYNNFVKWLWNFCGKYNLAVKQFDVNDKAAAGVVHVMVLLTQDLDGAERAN
jgi:general secretion pathway protein M